MLGRHDQSILPTPLAELHPDFVSTFGRPAGLWLPCDGPEKKAYDLSGNEKKNVGSLNGGITTTPGGWGTLGAAWKLSSGTVKFTANAAWQWSSGQKMTCFALVKWDGSSGNGSYRNIIRSETTNPWYLILNTTQKIVFTTANDLYANGVAMPTDGGWHLVGGGYDGTNAHTYIDGVDSYSAADGALSTNSADLYLGSQLGAGQLFPGSIAIAGLFKSFLSATQWLQLYNCLLTGEPFPLFTADPLEQLASEFSATSARYFLPLGDTLPTPLSDLHPDFVSTFGRPAFLTLPCDGPEKKAYDLSGNEKKNVGTMNGGILQTPNGSGVLGAAWNFTPTSSQYIQVANSGLVSGVNLTIAAIIRIPNGQTGGSGGRAIYCERAASGNDIVKLDCLGSGYSSSCDFVLRNDAGTLLLTKGTRTVNDGKVHFVVAVKNGTVTSLYVDGTLDASGAWSGTDVYTNSLQTRIGGDAGDPSAYFAGDILFCESYRFALTAAQVSDLYTCFKTGEPFPLFAQANPLELTEVPAPVPGTSRYFVPANFDPPGPMTELHPDFVATFGRPVLLTLPCDGPEKKAYDLSGNEKKNVGSLNGGITTTPGGFGVLGTAWNVTSTGYATFANAPAQGSAFSASVWYSTTNTTLDGANVFGRATGAPDGANDYDWMLYFDQVNGVVRFFVKNAAGSTDNLAYIVNFNDGAVHQFGCTFLNGAMAIIWDGVLVASKTSTVTSIRNAVPLALGVGWGSKFTGNIYAATLFSQQLTAAQVSALYNCLRTGEPFPLFAPSPLERLFGSVASGVHNYSETGSGGGIGGGSATIVYAGTAAASGGGIGGGSAGTAFAASLSAAGGGIGGGSATAVLAASQTGTGGGIGSGSVNLDYSGSVGSTGGGVGGGSSTLTYAATISGSGGGLGSGIGTVVFAASIIGSGGGIGGGSAGVSGANNYTETGSGGGVGSGISNLVYAANIFSSGGAIGSGSAASVYSGAVSSIGGAIGSGSASLTYAAAIVGSGGAVGSGTAVYLVSGATGGIFGPQFGTDLIVGSFE